MINLKRAFRYRKLGLLIFLPFIFGACDLINPEEPIPAYIFVPDFELVTDPATEGSNAHKITDVWITIDGAFLGAYPLPATIPVLSDGNTDLIFEAGVKENGFGATPNIYPFYEQFEVKMDLLPGLTDTIRPVIGYREAANFTLIENFESGSNIFQDVLNGNGTLESATGDVFEGNRSGKVMLTEDDAVFEVASIGKYPAESFRVNNVTEVWLEIHYKSDVPVAWGFLASQSGVGTQPEKLYDPVFNSKDEWNKIYFNLSSLLFQGSFESYQLAFLASIPIENGNLTLSEATVLLDNIKLVHF